MSGVGRAWWVKAGILLAFMIPPLVERGFDPRATSDVVRVVLARPWVNELGVVRVGAKYALLVVALVCLARPALLARLVWGYYAVALVIVAFGQNVAHTDRFGWAWLVGNTVIQLAVAALVAFDVLGGWSSDGDGPVPRGRLWVLLPMALAWWFPFAQKGSDAVAGGFVSSLANGAGLTYCMITPLVLGVMILRSEGIHRPTLSVVAWTGLLFGVTNLLVWFVVQPSSWWMGVLHLPLTALSAYALWLGRSPRRAGGLAEQPGV